MTDIECCDATMTSSDIPNNVTFCTKGGALSGLPVNPWLPDGADIVENSTMRGPSLMLTPGTTIKKVVIQSTLWATHR